MRNDRGLLKLALACLFAWALLIGLFMESIAQPIDPSDVFLIIGTVTDIEIDGSNGSALLRINDGTDDWTFRIAERPSWLFIGSYVSALVHIEGGILNIFDINRL